MAYVLFICSAILLLIGFLALTWFERKQGMRFFDERRTKLDTEVGRITFILAHVDFAAFFREELRRLLARAGHDIAHGTLQGVRAVERVLTRVVRHFRSKGTVAQRSRESVRPFVQTLSHFKEHLEANRPHLPEIEIEIP